MVQEAGTLCHVSLDSVRHIGSLGLRGIPLFLATAGSSPLRALTDVPQELYCKVQADVQVL